MLMIFLPQLIHLSQIKLRMQNKLYLPLALNNLQIRQERWPKIQFHPLREHAGLTLQK